VVGKDDHMLAVVGDRIDAGRVDDDRSVEAVLLLIAAVAVIPVGARLDDRELIVEGLARPDPREADARHAVHRERHEHAVPMNR